MKVIQGYATSKRNPKNLSKKETALEYIAVLPCLWLFMDSKLGP
jgi:hypothetical protein